ncbi:hypothetical protein DSL72_006075 [Monilinia vaccinii-corymbosi]|uniref:Uncharacterized protein n=1 Tax=Monilinia vaccinii-corymbosi TaxID=61207 RepID=A0A8A3PHL6_9HELO|nr:hypothetical protein DSL72_006075 [Monilinia vaccinii-corymbosi]
MLIIDNNSNPISPAIKTSNLDAADRHLRIIFRALPQKTSESVDLLPLLLPFTVVVSTEFLFGKAAVHSQTAALQSIDSGATKELLAEGKFVKDTVLPLRFSKFWWLARSRKFLDAYQIFKDYSANFVQSALNPSSRPSSLSSSLVYEKGINESAKKQKYGLLNALTEQTGDPTEPRDQMLLISSSRAATQQQHD